MTDTSSGVPSRMMCQNGHDLVAGVKYCPECGAPSWQTCQNGHEIPKGNKFCPECGQGRWTSSSPIASKRTDGFAITSLVLGLLWIGGIGALLAIVFGALGLRRIKESAGAISGRGLAVAGVILGCVGVLASAIAIVVVAAP